MRCAILTATVFMTSTLSVGTHAQTFRCASIRDHDQRMTCNAVTSGHKSWCGFVKDTDKRAWCYVLVEKKN